MSNLGVGYTPEINGEKLELQVLAQHGNNLILRDNVSKEPIQQIHGYREKDGTTGPVMKPWPSFRMSFRGFQKAYPQGKVFLNKPPGNKLLALFDMAVETIMSSGILRQHQEAKPFIENMSHFDDRLPNKTYVWGLDIGSDAVCYTDDFIVENDGLINAVVGGRRGTQLPECPDQSQKQRDFKNQCTVGDKPAGICQVNVQFIQGRGDHGDKSHGHG